MPPQKKTLPAGTFPVGAVAVGLGESSEEMKGRGVVRRGDPPSFTPEKREAFLSLVSSGCTRSEACRRTGVSYSTFVRAMKASSDFAEAVEGGEREGWDIALRGLREAVEEREPWAIQWVLKNQRQIAREWDGGVQRVEVNHTGSVEQRVTAEGLEGLVRDLQDRQAELADVGMADVLDVRGRELGPLPPLEPLPDLPPVPEFPAGP